MIRRALEFGWPTALVASACVGLMASNWVRPPPLLLLACGVVATALGARSAGGAARAGALAVVLLVAGLWWGGLRLESLDESVLSTRLGESRDARVIVSGPARFSRFAVRVPAEVRRFDGETMRERVLLELPPVRAPPQGAVLELRARAIAPRGPETGFDERGWLARKGVHVVLRGGEFRRVGSRGGVGGIADRLRAHVAAALARGGTGERTSVLAGVVLGEDEGIDQQLRDDFRASGLYHLLAVSGQNVAFVVGGVLATCWLLGIGRLVGEGTAIVAVGAYVLAVGWQPSVVRAGVAGVLASLAWLASRPRDRWHFLALGALVLLLWTPAMLLDPGFQLSFAAVAAILVSVGRLRLLQAGVPLPWRVVELAGIAAVCGVATAPILWLQFGTIPLWTVPANALAEPAMPLLLGLGLAAAVVEPVSGSAATALAWLAGWSAAWIAFCARLIAGLPYAQTSSPLPLLALGFGAAALLLLRRLSSRTRRRSLALAGVAAVVAGVFAWNSGGSTAVPPPAGLRVSFLDVGQGDAALLQVPEGAVLVDQGSAEADVAGRLARLGAPALSALVLTHPQRDHVGGAEDVLRARPVETVLEPGLSFESSEDDAALAAARARSVRTVVARAGQTYRLGRLELRVLWPEDAGLPSEDPNENSVVLLATYGRVEILLTADAESHVTRRLGIGAVDVLKVAHHGSRDDALASLLGELRPRIAVISAGRDNDYGHPHPDTLEALGSVRGLDLYRTDEQGDVIVESDGRSLTVRTTG